MRRGWCCLFFWLLGCCVAIAETPWHTTLYLANGNVWQQRIPITLRNDSDAALAGERVSVTIGQGPDQLSLVNADARDLRVCLADGSELLYRLAGPDGRQLKSGPIPQGAVLTIPAECPAKSSATVYVYAGNPDAWAVPEFLDAKGQPARATVTVGAVERLPVKVLPAPTAADGFWGAPLRVVNSGAARTALVHADAAILVARGGRENPRLRVSDAGRDVASVALSGGLVFEAALPELAIKTFHVACEREKTTDDRAGYVRLMTSALNLAKNADFEAAMEKWTVGGGAQMGLDSAGLFGPACAKLHVPASQKPDWAGFRQAIAVRPGGRYVFAAWIKCKDVEGSAVALHAHWHQANKKLCQKNAFASAGGPGLKGSADWTLVSGVLTAPDDAASIEIHLTTNTTGTVWYDGILLAEVVPGLLGPVESRMAAAEGDVAIWPVNPVVKVFREDLPPARNSAARPATLRLSAARNEAEPLQLGVRAAKSIKQVTATVESLTHAGGARLDDVAVAVVGYVPVDYPSNYYRVEVPAWRRRIPTWRGACDGWAGFWPDPLIPTNTFDLEPQRTQPLWITVNVPKNAPAGDYSGKVKLTSGGATVAEMPLVVRVWDFALPDQSHVKAIYDLRINSQFAPDWKKRQDAWRGLSAFLARRRLCPDRISPEPVLKWEGGKVLADFTEYDKAAEEYFKLGHAHTYTPSVFYLFGWAHPPKKNFGVDPYEGAFPYDGVDRGTLKPEYKRAYQACLKVYLDHMKAKGWYDKVLLYISDEPHFWEGKGRNTQILAQMKALCAMIQEVDPKLPIYSSTWHHIPEWDGAITAWGIGAYGVVPAETIPELFKSGARVIWTTDGHMCTDTPYCAIERLLPHYCFKYGVEGYEFWGATWLTYNPWEYGWHSFIRQADKPGHDYYIRYPNGDGFLIYPGAPVGHDGPVTTVRLEQAREGVEDYEYLWLLRQRIAAAKSAGRDVAAAQKVLDDAQTLVTIPNAGGRYSTKILSDPDRVLQVRELVARAIESLR